MDYFIADTHFGHENIIKYEKRPYKNKEEMDLDMIRKWNGEVNEEDEVYHIGDFGFWENEKTKKELKKLNGKKYFIRGNHDFDKTNTKWKELGFDEALTESRKKDTYYLYEKDGYKIALSHYPLQDCAYFNIHGHVHSKIGHLNPQNHFCVSVECIEYKPISWEEIKKILEERKIKNNL